jgi:hypothetical protein
MRSMWVDYIKSSMPYDGNNCECIKDDSCGTSTISSSENSDTLLWGKQSSTSSSSMVHGSTHVSFPSNPNPPVPESSESRPQTSGNYSSHAKHADNISQTLNCCCITWGFVLHAAGLASRVHFGS